MLHGPVRLIVELSLFLHPFYLRQACVVLSLLSLSPSLSSRYSLFPSVVMSAPDASNPGPMEVEEEQQPLSQPSITSGSTQPVTSVSVVRWCHDSQLLFCQGGVDWNPPNTEGSSQPFTPPHISPARPPAPPPFQLPPPGGLPNQQQSAQPAHSTPNSVSIISMV